MGCVPVVPIIPLEYAESLSYMEWLIMLTKQQNSILGLLDGNIDDTIAKYLDDNISELQISASYKNGTIYFNSEVQK